MRLKKALLFFGDDPRYSQHLACWSEIFKIAPDEILADLVELKSLLNIDSVDRNRSKNGTLFTELLNGEIINGQQETRLIFS